MVIIQHILEEDKTLEYIATELKQCADQMALNFVNYSALITNSHVTFANYIERVCYFYD
jgi:hypothetical protein